MTVPANENALKRVGIATCIAICFCSAVSSSLGNSSGSPVAYDPCNSEENDYPQDECDAVRDFTEAQLFNVVYKNYKPQQRPVLDALNTVNVTVRLDLRGIEKFDERNNLLTLLGVVHLFWVDEFFRWNDTDNYKCQCSFVVPASLLWLPDVGVVNSPDGGQSLLHSDRVKVWAYSDGRMYYEASGVLAVKCFLDIKWFFFDYQTCSIIFRSRFYTNEQMVLNLPGSFDNDGFYDLSEAFTVDYWTEHMLWKLVDEDHENEPGNELYYGNTITFTLVLERKPAYYYMNLVLPSFILSLTVLVIFVMPVNEMAKIAVAFTVLLAFSIFQMMVVNDIPKSSQATPLVSIYIIAQRCYIAIFIIGGQGVVFHIIGLAKASEKDEEADGRHAPSKCLWLFCNALGTVLLVRHITKYKTAKFNSSGSGAGTKTNLCATDKWTHIANVLERVFFIFYLAAVIATPIVMIKFTPKYEPPSDSKYDHLDFVNENLQNEN